MRTAETCFGGFTLNQGRCVPVLPGPVVNSTVVVFAREASAMPNACRGNVRLFR
jgi:hypothetical protein